MRNSPEIPGTFRQQFSFLLLLGIGLLLGAWMGNAEWKDRTLAAFAFGRGVRGFVGNKVLFVHTWSWTLGAWCLRRG